MKHERLDKFKNVRSRPLAAQNGISDYLLEEQRTMRSQPT